MVGKAAQDMSMYALCDNEVGEGRRASELMYSCGIGVHDLDGGGRRWAGE